MTNSQLFRNILAVAAGIFIGGSVNGALIAISPSLIALPPGVDPANPESLAKAMNLFQPRHFVMPFLAHAIGTFTGALAAYLIAAMYKVRVAYAIGILFLCGGVAASIMIPAPAWFITLDLLVAYIPMAWLAIRTASRVVQPTR